MSTDGLSVEGGAVIRVRAVEPDLVFFLSDGEAAALRGELFPKLAPQLDGRKTVEEIAESLNGHATRLDVVRS